jgi:hypothetical protein
LRCNAKVFSGWEMIRRNRKKRLRGFVLPAPFTGIVVAASFLCLSYIWLGSRCDSIGRDIKAMEKAKDQLKKELLNEESRWTRMKSPANIEMVLAKRGIVMTWPRQDQVVRLYEGDAADVAVKRVNKSLTYVKRGKAVIHD